MTSRHLISDGYLSLLRDIYLNYLVYSGRKLIAVIAAEDSNVNYDTRFTVRQSERGITNLSCLFSEDSAEQSFLGGKLGLSLGSNLTYEYIARMNLGTDTDDTVGIKIADSVIADIGKLAGDFLGSELGIAGLAIIFLNVNRGINVISYETLSVRTFLSDL